MDKMVALVIVERAASIPDLDRALRDGSFEVVHRTPDEVVVDPVHGSAVDVVLASASLGLQKIALLSRHLNAGTPPPTLLVFPEEGDYAALESCVRSGFDFVAPPFLPTLLRSRMASCKERGKLALAVEELAAAASLRQYEQDLDIARQIQAGFLPETLPSPHGWEFAARTRPARQVGGDFYDGFELVNGRRLGFIVADVCDKGVGAALFMALIRTLLRHTAEHTGGWDLHDAEPDVGADSAVAAGTALTPLLALGAGPLVQAVVGTNRYMAKNHLRQGYFATLFFGVLDPVSGALLYINGGHNPPVLARARGGHTLLQPTGPAVGILADSGFLLHHTSLDPGDSLLVYTDGVVEARNGVGGQFGMDSLIDIACGSAPSAEALLDRVDTGLHHHVGAAEQFDDITMLALRRTAVR
ncbi:serine phosphatase RsbU (regulator of sigma subunit) [Saccharothrix tamanrassetensis]|uniref:Serine phosphatase RsbU (Regulator of sigma subunit) n=1 Tax=Saccharothrix tamanrassetensis TaxID=1051531 RepID=A0A841CE95_9PSEU|nr:PP2C family protein-serine/threonine phosphatase [Saccharothrix tamanrassetensis]MBB5954345.1 serine phosphatase RsbU (regulator of sigma subunit) [Saccharothrix tamanrassetensis]